MEKAVLISGGAGFIGSNLSKRLSNKFDKVIIIDNLCRGKESYITEITNKVFLNINISNLKECKEKIETLYERFLIEEVWHLAANSDIPAGVEDIRVDLENTFLTTYSLVCCFKKRKPKRFFFASSSAVYGNLGDLRISENTGPLLPISNYGSMKLASEALLSSWVESNEVSLTIFRFPNVVGYPATHGIIYDFIRKLEKNNSQLNVLGNGKQKKPYLLMDDLIDAMLFIKNKNLEKRSIFNIGPEDDGILVSDIAKIVCEETNNQKAEIVFEENEAGWVGDVPRFFYDISKLKSIGWKNTKSSHEAIRYATKLILQNNKTFKMN